jgi:hypothetical protein
MLRSILQRFGRCSGGHIVSLPSLLQPQRQNAANLRGHAKGIDADPQLKFRKALAMCMLENSLNDEGKIVRIVPRCLRNLDAVVAENVLKTCLNNTGKCVGNGRSDSMQIHQKTVWYCGCNPWVKVCTYCTFNKAVIMCKVCHKRHVIALNNQVEIRS